MFARSLSLARPLLRLARPAARPLHASARRYATPGEMPTPEQLMANPKVREVFQKIAQHPGAVQAITAVGEVLKRHGLDSGKRPGMLEMAKLMMDKEFKEASLKLKEELDKAGIDMRELQGDLGGLTGMLGSGKVEKPE